MEPSTDLKRKRSENEAENQPHTSRGIDGGSPAGMPLFLMTSPSIPTPEQKVPDESAIKLQAKLKISSPADPDEREADRVAEQFISGSLSSVSAGDSTLYRTHRDCTCESGREICSACQSGSLVNVKRDSDAAQASAPFGGASGLQLGAGRPLDAAPRRLMESRFGQNFEHVRIHTDSAAARSAEGLSAEAYTMGRDVVFGDGRYEPTSNRSLKLLAHELTHVVQQSGREARINRDPRTPPAPNPARLDMDPCDVNVPSLTNAELVAQLYRTRTYLDARRRGQDDYYAYDNLKRRLLEERRRRARMGHVWLMEDASTVPTVLYEVRPGQGLEVLVLPADVSAEGGMPISRANSRVLSLNQFQRILDQQGIPTIDIETWFARQNPLLPSDPLRLMVNPPAAPRQPSILPFLIAQRDATMVRSPIQALTAPFGQTDRALDPGSSMATSGVFGGGLYASPFDIAGRPFVSQPVFSPNVNMNNPRSVRGAQVNWRGALPEMSFGRGDLGSWLAYRDLNTLMPPNQRNFEVWDFRNRFTGDLVSVTHTLPNASGEINWAQYDTKFMRAIGAQQPGNMNTALGRLNAQFGTSLTIVDANQRTYLAINADHVDQYRTRLRADILTNHGDYTNLLDALLRAEPSRVGTSSFNTWNALQAARANNTISQAEFDAQLQELSRRASLRVISNGMTSQQILNMQTFRARYQGIPEAEFGSIAAPLFESEGFGGGTSGRSAARGASGRRGGVMGGVTTAAIDLARFAWDPDAHPHALRELGVDVGLGTAGGYGGSMIESEVNMRLSQMLLDQAAAEVGGGGTAAAMSRLAPLTRGVGGFAAGAVIAPATVMGSMAIDDMFFGGQNTYIDYSARGTRAFVSGSIASGGGALAAGLTGAAFGTEVPILGNIVGFIVGIGIYYIVDATAGEAVESDIRSGLGEGGCPRPTPLSRDDDLMWMGMGACFTGETLVLMADGSSRAIASLSEGAEVLAFDVEKQTLRPERVLSQRAVDARPYLQLKFSGGRTSLNVTPEHPIYSEEKWMAAGSLKVGASVVCARFDTGDVAPAELIEVKPADNFATVYNLGVSGCHTFFAEGILVHNKNI